MKGEACSCRAASLRKCPSPPVPTLSPGLLLFLTPPPGSAPPTCLPSCSRAGPVFWHGTLWWLFSKPVSWKCPLLSWLCPASLPTPELALQSLSRPPTATPWPCHHRHPRGHSVPSGPLSGCPAVSPTSLLASPRPVLSGRPLPAPSSALCLLNFPTPFPFPRPPVVAGGRRDAHKVALLAEPLGLSAQLPSASPRTSQASSLPLPPPSR